MDLVGQFFLKMLGDITEWGGTKKISGGAGGSIKDDAMTEKTPIVAHSNTIFVKF